MKTVEGVVSEYIEYCRTVLRYSDNTILSYQTDLNNFSEYCLMVSKTDMSTHSERTVLGFLAHLNSLKRGKKTIARYLSSLRQLYKYAIQHDFINLNPVKNVHNPKTPKTLPDLLSVEEMQQLLDSINKSLDSYTDFRKLLVASTFELLYGCSLRVSEVCSAALHDFSPQEKTLRIKGKGSKTRIVPVGDKSLRILNDYLKVRPKNNSNPALLIEEDGKSLYPRKIHRWTTKLISSVSSIRKKSPHILRHSSATHMLDNGAALPAIKEILGHSNLKTTQIYTQVSIERLKKVHKQSHPKS